MSFAISDFPHASTESKTPNALSLIIYSGFGLNLPSNPPPEFFILGWFLVDGSHVYSTLLVSYSDPEMFRKLKPILIAVPLSIFALAFVSHFSGYRSYFIIFLAYLAVIHFIRQEFGWMKLATRLDPSCPRWLARLDIFSSYAMTILPMLWFLRNSGPAHWYEKGDMVAVPDIIGNTALNLYLPVVFVFLAGNIWHSYKTKTINSTKFLVAINTFFGWYMAKIHVQNAYIAVWLLIFHHGFPYYFLVFKTERITATGWRARLGPLRVPAMYLTCVALFGAVFYFPQLIGSPQELKSIPHLKSAIYAFAVFPQASHFILDAYIWKKKYGLVK